MTTDTYTYQDLLDYSDNVPSRLLNEKKDLDDLPRNAMGKATKPNSQM